MKPAADKTSPPKEDPMEGVSLEAVMAPGTGGGEDTVTAEAVVHENSSAARRPQQATSTKEGREAIEGRQRWRQGPPTRGPSPTRGS
jgi:hypothetical protein